MPRTPGPTPIQELPNYDHFLAIIARAQALSKDPLSKFVISEAESGAELFKKDVKHIVEELSSPAGRKETNVVDLDRTLRQRSNALEKHLVAEARADFVATTKKQRSGTAALADAFISYSLTSLKDDDIAVGLAKKAKVALDAWNKAQSRRTESGHKVFDATEVESIRRCWIHHDNAVDLLRALLRRAGVQNDPIFGIISNVRSPLRPTIGAGVKQKASSAKARRAGKKGKGDGGAAGGNGGGSPGTPGNSPA